MRTASSTSRFAGKSERSETTPMSFDDDARETPTPAADQIEPRLQALARQFGPDELALWLIVGERLLKGRRRYGELRLSEDRRCFASEALEEAADGLVYTATALLREVSR